MLTPNVDIPDRLINGQIGTIAYVHGQNDTTTNTIYVIF